MEMRAQARARTPPGRTLALALLGQRVDELRHVLDRLEVEPVPHDPALWARTQALAHDVERLLAALPQRRGPVLPE